TLSWRTRTAARSTWTARSSVSLWGWAVCCCLDARWRRGAVGLLLQSGDVLVMAGSVRRAFHGVLLVVDGTMPVYLADDAGADGDGWAECGQFMAHTRLHVNVRQVLAMAAAAQSAALPASRATTTAVHSHACLLQPTRLILPRSQRQQ
ncbi:hypothetical protein BC831DRAFT_540443, partial [Entophlyctis helioformis]